MHELRTYFCMAMNNDDLMSFSYPVMEHFATIQGEGFHSGKAAYFIRLGGCDVGCHWCDVKESWPTNAHPHLSIKELLNFIEASGFDTVVVTGGEPAMHDLNPLTSVIRDAGFKMHIETSGAHELSGEWDWITFSPKKFKAPKEHIYRKAHELKAIVFHKSDFEFAELHAEKVNDQCLLYLQPEWSKREQSMPMIVDYINRNPAWRVSLQTHKYLNIP